MKLAIFLEQYEMGGVDTHLITMLLGWPSSDDSFLILVNENHKGLKRLEEELGGRETIQIRPYAPFSYAHIQMTLGKSSLTSPLRAAVWLLFPVFFFLQVLCAYRILKQYDLDGLLADNGNYPGGQGVLASIVAASYLGIPRRVLLVHHSAIKPSLFRSSMERWIDEIVTRSATELDGLLCRRYQ